MNTIINFEDMVSCSRSKREGESSQDVCDRLDLTRDDSQRQLPTDHDYAVSTREYQLDQSSPLPASAAADPVFERQRQKQTPRIRAYIDRVTPYQRPLSCVKLVSKPGKGHGPVPLRLCTLAPSQRKACTAALSSPANLTRFSAPKFWIRQSLNRRGVVIETFH